MRYTTIIDISEFPSLYRNQNVRLVYLHMVLRSGYHDDDRDVCELSIRRLALETNLTLSATRHALKILESAKLIERFGAAWKVKKFIMATTITPRVKSEKKRQELEYKAIEDAKKAEQNARDEEYKRLEKERRKKGTDAFCIMVEELKAKADMGDLDAAERFRFWRKQYEAHKAKLLSEMK